MVLATHMVIAAAAAGRFGLSPVGAVVTGVVSHFILDMIPHWDYPLGDGFKIGGRLGQVWPKVIIDLALGLSVSALFFGLPWAILAALFGAVLPDILQFVYHRFQHQVLGRSLKPLQDFHEQIHAQRRLQHVLGGVFLQTVLAGLVLLAATSL